MKHLFIELYLDEDVDVLVAELAVRRPPHEIARRLRIILNHVTADEMKNQLRYI